MNRTTLSLIGVIAALAAAVGIAYGAAPVQRAQPAGGTVTGASLRKPVQRSTLVCPAPTGSDYISTVYTGYTPPGTGVPSSGGSASLTPVDQTDGVGDTLGNQVSANPKPFLPLATPGTPVTATANSGHTYPLFGSADGRFAPGWSVQETTTVDAGQGLGLLGTACGQAGTDFWFPGAGTVAHREDFVTLTNPDATPAVADVELYDDNGPVSAPNGQGMTIPGHSSVPVLLSTLTGEQSADLTVHVQVRTGRVGAALETLEATGADWMDPAAPPADSAVLPGIPADATDVRLVGYATGGDDADLKVQLLTPSGAITPAGQETLQLRSGVTTSVDLPRLTRGQPGSLLLTPADPSQPAPFVAAATVTRGSGGKQDLAFIPATGPVGPQATAPDNGNGTASTLSLTTTNRSATVRITSSATTQGGASTSKTVTLQPYTTVALAPPAPGGSGGFAVTVRTVSGGPVYAARELTATVDGVPGFTVQTLPDDGGYVEVPQAAEDLSVLEP